uniref:Uncharacterized protein n=1 Tax=Arundo donax TaxID=35708 RepID=A0A0A9C233_ARUDO
MLLFILTLVLTVYITGYCSTLKML